MSTVISAYNIERHVRSADDVAGEINEEKPAPSKPKPQCKQVWGSLTEGPEKTVAFLAERVKERFRAGNELVCILDGEPLLWRLVYRYFPAAFFVLDIFHVLEHIADVAHCFFKEKSPEAKKFVRQRLRMLLEGKGRQSHWRAQADSYQEEAYQEPEVTASGKLSAILNETSGICATNVCLKRGLSDW